MQKGNVGTPAPPRELIVERTSTSREKKRMKGGSSVGTSDKVCPYQRALEGGDRGISVGNSHGGEKED